MEILDIYVNDVTMGHHNIVDGNAPKLTGKPTVTAEQGPVREQDSYPGKLPLFYNLLLATLKYIVFVAVDYQFWRPDQEV